MEFLANKDLRLEIEIIELYTRIDNLLIENMRMNRIIDENIISERLASLQIS